MPARPVTIVVHVYEGWSSLERCIMSILENVDLSIHSVLLVNDCGPRADDIEARVLEAIAGAPSIAYHRNVRNLGFVRTCNRAVYEIDTSDNDVLLLNSDAALTPGALNELVAVLNAAEHHGAVCPRGNRAGIASFPYFHRPTAWPNHGQAESELQVFDAVSDLLPRWYLSPVAVGFCILLRRSLINNYGLFDPIYALEFGDRYGEDDDLCMRINAAGFSSLIANRAFVARAGSATSTEAVKNELEARNRATLLSRYPFYVDAVNTFVTFGYSAPEVFAEIIATQDHMSILVDIRHLSHAHNGSTRYALSFLKTLSRATLPKNVSVTIAAPAEAIVFFDLQRYGMTVLPYQDVTGAFDVGIALAPVNSLTQLMHLNDHCARWVVSHFDMIQARAWNLMLRNPTLPMIVEQGLAHADRVVALSDFALKDAAAYYPPLRSKLTSRGESVHLGSTRDATGDRFGGAFRDHLPLRIESILDGGSYIVVLGNSFPHKQVALAARALESLETPVIAFGPIEGLSETPARAIATSGTLSDSAMGRIIEGAALVIFPSAYEGYGLPVPDSLDCGVPVVAFDTVVSREVVKELGGQDAVRFFTRFDELAAVATEALGDVALHEAAAAMRGTVRGLDPYAERLLEIALEQLKEPLDVARLTERYESIKRMQRLVSSHHDNFEYMWRETLESESFKIGHRIVKMIKPVSRLFRRR